MSTRCLSHVFECAEEDRLGADLSSGAMFVLVALADQAHAHDGEDWTCWPSIRKIQLRTRQGRATVERHLRALVEAGWLSCEPRTRANGSKTSNTYVLHRKADDRARLASARALLEAAGLPFGRGCSDLERAPWAEWDAVEAALGGAPLNLRGGYPPKRGEGPPDVGGPEPLLEPISPFPPHDGAKAAAASSAATPYGFPRDGAADAEAQALLAQVFEAVDLGDASMARHGAFVGVLGQGVYLVTFSQTGADALERNRAARDRLSEAWRRLDALGRSIQIVSRKRFAELVAYPAGGGDPP